MRHAALYLLPLILVVSQFAANVFAKTAIAAPKCPSAELKSCSCGVASSAVSVTCTGDFNLSQLSEAFTGVRIDHLYLSNCTAADVLAEPLPKLTLRSLQVVNCPISEVHEKAFDSVSETVEELVLSNCSLKQLPFLAKLKQLRTLDLSRNQLENIAERALEGLDQLRRLKLAHNKICSPASNALTEVKSSLEVLDLSNNCLTAVPAQNIRNSLKLTTLDLSGNEIGELQRLQFMNLPALKQLSLDNNRLAKLSPMAFMNVPELSRLSLSGNQLAGIEPGALQAFKSLQVIDLSGNAITQIPSFKQLLHLRQVRLDNNRIERVETLTFSENPKLQLISLRDNRISLIARNSFDALDQLSIVLLGNNSLTVLGKTASFVYSHRKSLERGMFDGMRNLKELHLETNSIREIYNNSLTSIPQLSVLDLSSNKLQKIRSGTFAPLQRLYWLDLSQNDVTTVENGAFGRGVGNVLLDGNPLSCDAELDWFVSYLVRNQVRTFLPQQPDVTCASPAERAGARLKELMMQKANETRSLIEATPAPMAPGDIIGNFFGLPPSTAPPRQILPGRLMRPVAPSQSSGACAPPTPEQVAQWVRTLPSFVVNVPGWGNIDISKLPPGIIEHVLRGGQINGVPSQALRAVVDQFRTYYAQACPQPVSQPVFTTAIAPPALPSVDFASVKTNASENGTMTEVLSPKVLRMLKLIPPGYNLSRLPPEVMQSVLRGDMPDLRLLPSDLLSYLRDHIDDLIIAFGPIGPDSPTIEDLLGKLPKFEQPALPTFSPYDINDIGSELIIKESDEIYKTRFYTAVALGLVGAVTLAILAIFCAFVKKSNAAAIQAHASTMSQEGTRNTPPKRSTGTLQRPPAHPPPPLPPSSTLRKTHLPAPSSATSTMRGFAPSSFEDSAYQRPFTTASGDPFRYAV